MLCLTGILRIIYKHNKVLIEWGEKIYNCRSPMSEKLSSFLSNLRDKLSLKGSIKNQEPSWKNTLTRALIGKRDIGKVDWEALKRENDVAKLKSIIEKLGIGGKDSALNFMTEGLKDQETMKLVFGQWTAVIGRYGVEFHNYDEQGRDKFYSSVPGEYNNPIRIVEPSYAFPFPKNFTYVNAGDGSEIDLAKLIYKTRNIHTGEIEQHPQLIGGVIFKDNSGKELVRTSFSNPTFIKTKPGESLEDKPFTMMLFGRQQAITYWHLTEDGIKIFQKDADGKIIGTEGVPKTIHLGDKNRQGNVDCEFVPDNPTRQVEVGELAKAKY